MPDSSHPNGHCVYWFKNRDGRCLYIGITANLGRRIGEHSKRYWFTETADIGVDWVPDKSTAIDLERLLIEDWRPVHNVMHNQPDVIKHLTPELQWGEDYWIRLADDRWVNTMYLWSTYSPGQHPTVHTSAGSFDYGEIIEVASAEGPTHMATLWGG